MLDQFNVTEANESVSRLLECLQQMDNSWGSEELKSFTESYLSSLPSDLMEEVLSFLPSKYISEVFLQLKHSRIRNAVIDQYYSHDIHFIFSPSTRMHMCVPSQRLQELIDIEGYYQIEEFLTNNEDINPLNLHFVSGNDFASLRVLLQKFGDRIKTKIKSLNISLQKYELTNDDMRLLLSFPNLNRLWFSGISFSKCPEAMMELFKCYELKELLCLAHGINDWSHIRLPPNLNRINISWNNSSDVKSLKIPDSVKEIYWNQSGIDNITLMTSRFPRNLKVLMLTYNNLTAIDVSMLPKTLNSLALSYNSIGQFFATGKDKSWPPNLSSILLSFNQLTNDSLVSLSYIKWPEFLETLKLDNNQITDLTNLSGLPDSLTYLDISSNKLKSLKASSGQFFSFPSSLLVLDLSNNVKLIFNDMIEYNSNEGHNERIKFPPDMWVLNLSECNIKSLKYFEFPVKLSKLCLSGNKIEDLESYDEDRDASTPVGWHLLTGMDDLELYYNKINDISGFSIPPNLKTLDLRLNQIQKIGSQFSHLRKLTSLQLGQNQIATLDPETVLPPNLKFLRLNDNKISGNIRLFAFNEKLRELDLSGNSIQGLLFSENISGSHYQLRVLNLTANLLLKKIRYTPEELRKEIDDFYNLLEANIGPVAKRKHNINSIHNFLW